MTGHTPPQLSPLEVLGTILGLVVGAGALLGALAVIWKAVKGIPHAIVVSVKWVIRFFKTVNIIACLPGRLDKLDDRFDHHLSEVAKEREVFQEKLDTLLEKQKVVVHEMQHNGGSSIKDDIKVLREHIDSLLVGLDQAQVTGQFILPKRDIQPKEPTGPIMVP